MADLDALVASPSWRWMPLGWTVADRDTIIRAVAGLALSTAIGLAAGLLAGLLLDPNDYPRDRPPPKLAVYATCPVKAP